MNDPTVERIKAKALLARLERAQEVCMAADGAVIDAEMALEIAKRHQARVDVDYVEALRLVDQAKGESREFFKRAGVLDDKTT